MAGNLVTFRISADLFSALGLDWQLLILQALAFLILVWALGKWVYPYLLHAIDERRFTIETGLVQAKHAHEALQQAELDAQKLLSKARSDAAEVVERAEQQAHEVTVQSEQKAQTQAALLVKEAHERIEHDIMQARHDIKRETIKLVAEATGRVIGEKLNQHKDAVLIQQALEKKEIQ